LKVRNYGVGIHEIVLQFKDMLALGIDIGGSGIKGAIVDTETGNLVSDRVRISTPTPSNADAVVATIRQLINELRFENGPVGIGFPGVIRENTIYTAANLEKRLSGMNLGPVRVINDADAAGFAEMEFGAGKPHRHSGTVLMLTIGTGIGTVLFTNGHLVPNLELGHIEFKKKHAESYVSERARIRKEMSWKKWGKRFGSFLLYLEHLLQPDLIILGGGGVKKPNLFNEYIDIETPWELAGTGNKAGIIGAALAACETED
jgi:polyphosphate glucokinase